MLFKDMNLTLNKDVKKVTLEGSGIEFNVKQYLPAEEKNAILEIAMQQADQGTILNTFALDAIFHIYLVFKYTDIEFTLAEKENILSLFDILETNGIIEATVAAIPVSEYAILRDNLMDMVDNYLTYRNSARALVEQFSMFAPQAAENLAEISQNVDVEKLQNILKLADYNGENNRTNIPKE